VNAAQLLVMVMWLGAAGVAGAPPTETGHVTVMIRQAERFTDFRTRCSGDARGLDMLRTELTSFLESAAAPHVRSPASLEITVTDVDMAGEFESWRGPQFCDVRTMRELYAPRIRLSFRLLDGQGQMIRAGDRDLRDATYLTRARVVSRDPLRYEKELLRDWIRDEFGGEAR
jgi:hypothetical protein